MMLRWFLVLIIAICNTLGDVLNAAGMRRQGELQDFTARSFASMLLQLVRNPYVLAGMAALTISFFAVLSLYSIANVTFAVPASASSYIFETLLAKYILKEHVGPRRWVAAVLVACGVMLLQF